MKERLEMTLEEIRGEYPYLYETHMHTSEASACGKCDGRSMARAYKENGYAGVIVTDHNWGGNTAIDRSLPWKEWIDEFFKGYEAVKAEGEKIGLQVFQGYEAGYHGPEFLIYGFTTEIMKRFPELKEATVEEQLKIVHSFDGMVIQAHPFREADYIDRVITYEKYVDGLEIVNASHSNPADGSRNRCVYDERAIALAKKCNLPGTAGSDQHSTVPLFGGVAFKTPLNDIHDYIYRIKNKQDYVITNGRQWFTKEGDLLLTCKD